jgi:hypothetical protein
MLSLGYQSAVRHFLSRGTLSGVDFRRSYSNRSAHAQTPRRFSSRVDFPIVNRKDKSGTIKSFSGPQMVSASPDPVDAVFAGAMPKEEIGALRFLQVC